MMKKFKLKSISLMLAMVMTLAMVVPTYAENRNFTNLNPSAWYYDQVMAVVDHGLMNGTSDTTFSPNSPLDRAMIVTVLWRFVGSPNGYTCPFDDVAQGSYYYRRWRSTRRPSAADLKATAETAGSVCWNSCLTKRPSKQKLSLRFLRFLPVPDIWHGKRIRETNLLLLLNKIKIA